MSTIQNALSGLLAAQTGLTTTSQNVANVMTPGYTRQGVLLAAVHLNSTRLAPGNGVEVSTLIRFSDGYKTMQMWQAGSELGRYSTVQPYFTQLEQVMGDDAASINSGLDAFFSALDAASVEPASIPLRQQVITTAEALAKRFNSLRQLLSVQRQSVQQQRSAVVAQINEITTNIAVLNHKIIAATMSGSTASGLLDERDRQIDALADLVGIQVIDQPDGSRTISLRDGPPLVVGTQSAVLSAHSNLDGSQRLQLDFAHESFTLPGGNFGGQLGGLDDFEGKVLVPLTQSIVDMARELTDRINAQMGAGYAMDGSTGTDLFEFDPSSVSAMLRVRSGIVAQDLAFSAVANEPGNSDNLAALIHLRNQPVGISMLGSVLLGDAYTQLVGRLGTDSQQNQALLKTAQTVRNQAEENWKSTSGVNSDEEASNLIQYQQMYQANMKVIAVANELFDSVLAMF